MQGQGEKAKPMVEEERKRDNMNTKITDEIKLNSINQFNDELFMCATYNEISTINEGCAVCA